MAPGKSREMEEEVLIMPDDTNQIARIDNNQLQTMPFAEAFEHYTPDLAAALPDHIRLDHFKRVVLTAVNLNPDLARADRRSLFNACSRCAHDGLYPDGREAALVVFRTKVKRGDQEYVADLVQYMPMVAGIRKRMRNTGEVLSADAQIVCKNDKFHYQLGDDQQIIHEPPPLGTDRGPTVGAYSIIKLANGEVLREVMSRADIERVRAFSRAKDGPAWTKSWDEMGRKTVLRRNAKAAPSGSDLERLLGRDDELPRIDAHTAVQQIPPAPRREDFREASVPEIEPPTELFESDDDDVSRETLPGSELDEAYADAMSDWKEKRGPVTVGEAAAEGEDAFGLPPLPQAPANDQPSRENFIVPPPPEPPARSHRVMAPALLPERPLYPDQPGDVPKGTSPSLTVPPRPGPRPGTTDWPGTADDMIARIALIASPEDTKPNGAFDQANRQTLDIMRPAAKQQWARVRYELGNRDRELREEATP